MSESILKSSISVLDAFNDVRNNRSFAHDNDILNYSESLLIFRNICAVVSFLQELETELADKKHLRDFAPPSAEQAISNLFD